MTVETTTTRRIRRVRCTGCTELFAREALTDGQCSRCASIVEMTDVDGNTFLAITEPVYWGEQELAANGVTTARAMRRGCDGCDLIETPEAPVYSYADGTYHAGCIVETSEDPAPVDPIQQMLDAERAEREEEQRLAVLEEQMVTSVAANAPRPAGWQPAAWRVSIYIGSQIHERGIENMTFDEAQKLARQTAKEAAIGRTGDDGQPIRARWINVKEWEVGAERVVIERS
jgi:hypothetical protein